MWTVELAIVDGETVTSQTRTLREAADMVFMIFTALGMNGTMDGNMARSSASSMERAMKAPNANRTSLRDSLHRWTVTISRG